MRKYSKDTVKPKSNFKMPDLDLKVKGNLIKYKNNQQQKLWRLF